MQFMICDMKVFLFDILGEWKPFKDISELKDKIIEKLIKANEDSNLGE